jgi:anti-sigma B factor antagonist
VQLKLSDRIVDGVLIIDCAGRVIFGEESASLRDTVKKQIAEKKRLVLNMSGVTFMDSGGLGTLVALYTTAHNSGGHIKLANLTQRVGDLLHITKLVTVFEVYDTEQAAVDAYKGAAA